MREFLCQTGTVIETDRKPAYRDYSEENIKKYMLIPNTKRRK
jgi:hypothetical protein